LLNGWDEINSVLRWARGSGRIFSLLGWFGLHQIPNSLAVPQAYSFPSLPFDEKIIPRLMLAGKKKCLSRFWRVLSTDFTDLVLKIGIIGVICG
jgi:hypothetical protein